MERDHEGDDWPRDDLDSDPWPDDDGVPVWFPGQHLPEHARRLGLTHHTQEGALLDFAGRLDPANRTHRVTAWVMLVALAAPALLTGLAPVLRMLGLA